MPYHPITSPAVQDAERESIFEFRKKYRGYNPWSLAKLRGTAVESFLEFTSFPFEDNGRVFIMARSIEDPTTNRPYIVRREISPLSWSLIRQRAYRAGWKAGFAYVLQEQARMLVQQRQK